MSQTDFFVFKTAKMDLSPFSRKGQAAQATKSYSYERNRVLHTNALGSAQNSQETLDSRNPEETHEMISQLTKNNPIVIQSNLKQSEKKSSPGMSNRVRGRRQDMHSSDDSDVQHSINKDRYSAQVENQQQRHLSSNRAVDSSKNHNNVSGGVSSGQQTNPNPQKSTLELIQEYRNKHAFHQANTSMELSRRMKFVENLVAEQQKRAVSDRKPIRSTQPDQSRLLLQPLQMTAQFSTGVKFSHPN